MTKKIRGQIDQLGLTCSEFGQEIGYAWITIQRFATGATRIPKLLSLYLEIRLWMKGKNITMSDIRKDLISMKGKAGI